MQEPYRKGSSESILTSSLAGDIARCFLKPQGGSISVLLSNVYLHYVLDLWFERGSSLGYGAKPIWCGTLTTLCCVSNIARMLYVSRKHCARDWGSLASLWNRQRPSSSNLVALRSD